MYDDESRDVLTVEEVAERLYIGRNTVYHLLNQGELQGFRIGRTWKIPKDAIADYIIKKCGR